MFSTSTPAAVMLRSAVEQRKGGDIPRGTVKGILFLTMETETQPMLHIPTVTTIKTQADKTDPRQRVIMYISKNPNNPTTHISGHISTSVSIISELLVFLKL